MSRKRRRSRPNEEAVPAGEEAAATSEPAAGQPQPDPAPILNATTGIIVLSTLLAFVLSWMVFLGSVDATNEEDGVSAIQSPAAVEGFRSDAWFLPDEPMLGFVRIPSGSFLMGSDPSVDRNAYANERWSEDQRQGEVDLPAFYISRYEVTVAQFQAFVADSHYSLAGTGWQGRPAHPVQQVAWTDAQAYARWLDARLRESGQTPAELASLLDDGWRVNLPNEAQWEKAARGSDGRIFPWGNRPRSELARFNANDTVPVTALECDPCIHGLQHMSGNVWELTTSPHQPYPWDPTNNFRNPAEDALMVMRGGSYSDSVGNIRAATRGGVDPGARRAGIGFRLVLTR